MFECCALKKSRLPKFGNSLKGRCVLSKKNAEHWFQTSYEFSDGTQITLKTNNVGLVKALLEGFAEAVGELDE